MSNYFQTDFSFLDGLISEPVKVTKPKRPGRSFAIADRVVKVGYVSEKRGTKLSAEHKSKVSASLKGIHKGREISQDYRDKISATLKRRHAAGEIDTTRARNPIQTPNGIYPSRHAVAAAAGVSLWTVGDWCRRYPKHYYVIKELR
jgi:hypothetical protein